MDDIISLTAKIVSAHIANNDVAAERLPSFIREVHQALATVGLAPIEPSSLTSSVDVRKSVFADHILCLDCGGRFKMLKRHISTDHQMTPDEYRAKWSLPPSYLMVAADYAATRSELAKDNGLGRTVQVAPSKATRASRSTSRSADRDRPKLAGGFRRTVSDR